jgi:hypothetical protein
VERDRILTRAALQWMREHPRQAASLYAEKLLSWFAVRNQLVSDRLVPDGSGAGPPWLRGLVMALGYGLLGAIALVRLAAARRVPFTALEVLLAVLYLGAAMAYAVFFTRIRFRLPFDWLLIALDALFLVRVLAPGTGAVFHVGPGSEREESWDCSTGSSAAGVDPRRAGPGL